MSIAILYNPPRFDNPALLDEWSFANQDAHEQIRDAIQRTKKIALIRYVLNPINPEYLGGFLLAHQASHNAFESILGIAGNDYSDFDVNDQQALAQVFYLHAESHRQASQILGL